MRAPAVELGGKREILRKQLEEALEQLMSSGEEDDEQALKQTPTRGDKQ